MTNLIFGGFFIFIGMYWFYTVLVLKNLSTFFPCHDALEPGAAEDSSMVDIVQGIIPACYRYNINLRITSKSLCLIPTGIWGWLPSMAIPRDQLAIVKYQAGVLPVIELSIHSLTTRLFVRGDGAQMIRDDLSATANKGLVSDAANNGVQHTP